MSPQEQIRILEAKLRMRVPTSLLCARDTQITGLMLDVEQRDERIKDLRAQLTQANGLIGRADERIMTLEARYKEHEAAIGHKDARIKDLEACFRNLSPTRGQQDYCNRITDVEALFREKNDELIKSKDERIKNLACKNSELVLEISSKDARIETLKGNHEVRYKNLTATREQQSARIVELEAQLKAPSSSWIKDAKIRELESLGQRYEARIKSLELDLRLKMPDSNSWAKAIRIKEQQDAEIADLQIMAEKRAAVVTALEAHNRQLELQLRAAYLESRIK